MAAAAPPAEYEDVPPPEGVGDLERHAAVWGGLYTADVGLVEL